MERVELQEAVARAIADTADPGADYLEGDWLPDARAAIGVVLAEAVRSIEALPARSFAPSLDAPQLWLERAEVLDALAALGVEACSWCDRVESHASRCPNA